MPYPKYLTSNMGEIGDEFLGLPDVAELDDSGKLSKAATTKMDKLLQADMVQRMKGFTMPDAPPRGANPDNRWRTVSCLQKAIRFGDVEMARFAASVAYDMDEAYLFRRLGVIAVEDVGVANMRGMMWALAALGSKAFRTLVDGRRLACFLADNLASGVKDRTLCDLVSIVEFGNLENIAMSHRPSEELGAMAIDPGHTTQVQMQAAWLLAGTKRFGSDNMPPHNDRPVSDLMSLMLHEGLSRGMLYAAVQTASRLGEAMWPSFLFVDRWLRDTIAVEIEHALLPDTPKVGQLLGAAYDMHTREGKTAIRKFGREQAGVLDQYLQHARPGLRDTMLYFGVFAAEGGMLNRRACYNGTKELRAKTLLVEQGYSGLPPELHDLYVATLQQRLPSLNECREKVLWAKIRSSS